MRALRPRPLRPIALSFAVTTTTSPIAITHARHALASETRSQPLGAFVIAQAAMGSPDDPPPAPSRRAPGPIPAPTTTDYVPPCLVPIPGLLPGQPNDASTDVPRGAIDFTTRGTNAQSAAIRGCSA